jgi:hypothetical protein
MVPTRKKRIMESSRAHNSSRQPSPAAQPTRIFCLYDQEDEQFYRKLQKHLYPLVRQQKMVWLEISAGDVLEQTILGHLRHAQGLGCCHRRRAQDTHRPLPLTNNPPAMVY